MGLAGIFLEDLPNSDESLKLIAVIPRGAPQTHFDFVSPFLETFPQLFLYIASFLNSLLRFNTCCVVTKKNGNKIVKYNNIISGINVSGKIINITEDTNVERNTDTQKRKNAFTHTFILPKFLL